MRFLSKVCIEFRHPKKREMVFKITGNDRLVLKDAPDWITEDPMFRWAVQDGTIEVVDTAFKQKELENDPMNGAGADGKIIKDGENDVSAIVEEMAEEIGQEAAQAVADVVEPEAPKKTSRRKKGE